MEEIKLSYEIHEVMEVNNSVFIKKYKQQLLEQVKLVHPDKPVEEIISLIERKISDKLNTNKYVANYETYTEQKPTNVLNILDYLETYKPIISGYGALYANHNSGIDNVLLDMVKMLLDERKVYKKKKFSHANDVDQSLFLLFDNYQLVFKLLNNSFFGAAGQPNSIFYDPYFSQAIMFTGQIIITTSIIAFESMTNNFYFNNLGDMVLYINRIMNDINEDDIKNSPITEKKTRQELANYLYSKFEGRPINVDSFKNIIRQIPEEYIDIIYYKNNLLEFINNKPIKDLLSQVIGKEFLDANEPSNEIKYPLDKLWYYTNKYVVYNYIMRNRTEFCNYHKRKTVLVVDTDSCFLYNRPFTNKMREFFPDVLSDYEENKSKKISTISLSMFFFTKLIAETYFHMGGKLNLPEEKRPIINMKGEFIYSRLQMTPAKKHYSGILWCQEGVIYDVPKLDMKGLGLRKTSLNLDIRNYFTNTLKDKILNPKQINLAEIYKDFLDKETAIRNNLKEGGIKYSSPGKVNQLDNYATPYGIQTVRGTILWNALFPDKPITPPEKINFIKLKPISYIDLIKRLPDEEAVRVERAYTTAKKYGDGKTLDQYDVNIIAFPKNTKKLPSWLTDLIDIDITIHDNIKPAMEILEPLDFKQLDIKTTSFSTNIIDL